jgi:DNA polymerase I-like protein with 3'-5' exonuclease and polymerase domains
MVVQVRSLGAVDFETHAIRPRYLGYPPVPVGVALYADDYPARYLAWGHPSGNNCTKGQAAAILKRFYLNYDCVFHHSAFDCDVGHVHLGLPLTPRVFHDTMFLAFLHDPRSETLSLKPLTHDLLGIAPRERDKLKDWIVKHVPNATEKDWGAYIADAPGDLVGEYARGDVTRTLKLYRFLVKALAVRDRAYPVEDGQRTLWDAYQRELKLMPVLLRMEGAGIRVDVKRLERDLPKWRKQKADLDEWVIKRLGGWKKVNKFAKKDEPFNVGSQRQLADALDAAGMISHWVFTAKGNRSVSKENLAQVIKDKKVGEALQKREIFDNYITTYGEKWLTQNKDGVVYPRINQVRNREDESRGSAGARTGRLSYSDSWQAIANVERIPFKDLPVLKDYVIPDEPGHVVNERDYMQQEFRILAHYEDGPLKERYVADPTIDMHTEALDMINQLTGLGLDPVKDRRPVKDTGFGLIYGMGLVKTAKKTKQDIDTARTLRSSYLQAIPGLPKLIKEIKRRCRKGDPIRTWGGRLYWVEEPKIIDGVLRNFDYKMINVLIQGSAGDCTKEAMIAVDERLRANPGRGRLLMQQHDALAASVPKGKRDENMVILRECMEAVPFDVAMLTDGKWSPRSWGSMKKYNDVR